MDANHFIEEFQDHLGPKLDTYEQAVYLYIFRHSRLLGLGEISIGFKSARKKMALGKGGTNTPMADKVIYSKLRSLAEKGCLEILGTERSGTRVHLRLPNEIPGVIPSPEATKTRSLEEMDFFEVPENRVAILEREGRRCFYCLRKLDQKNHVIEHVFRPKGDNSYRNVVAACRNCNNRKNDLPVADFLRVLFRDGILSESELKQRLETLERLAAGDLKPIVKSGVGVES